MRARFIFTRCKNVSYLEWHPDVSLLGRIEELYTSVVMIHSSIHSYCFNKRDSEVICLIFWISAVLGSIREPFCRSWSSKHSTSERCRVVNAYSIAKGVLRRLGNCILFYFNSLKFVQCIFLSLYYSSFGGLTGRLRLAPAYLQPILRSLKCGL